MVLCLVAGIVILADQIGLSFSPGAALKTGSDNVSGTGVLEKVSPLESLSVYQEVIGKRDLFNANRKTGEGEIRESSVLDLVKDYRLRGIALFTSPEGIIEDAATGHTVFVKEGEKLGQVTVKQIKGESIVLSYDGEEFELKIQGGEIQ